MSAAWGSTMARIIITENQPPSVVPFPIPLSDFDKRPTSAGLEQAEAARIAPGRTALSAAGAWLPATCGGFPAAVVDGEPDEVKRLSASAAPFWTSDRENPEIDPRPRPLYRARESFFGRDSVITGSVCR